MSSTHAPRPRPARLGFEDGVVVVTPKDRDIFLINASKATEACRRAILADERIKQFESEVLLPLHEWCVRNRDRVAACYLPLPAGEVNVFVVGTAAAFDFALAESVAELELRLSRAGWRVSLSLLPAAEGSSLATFFSPEGALEVYAHRQPAPEES